MEAEAAFRLGTHALPPAESALARDLCRDATLTANALYCKWEAYALAHDKPDGAPSLSDLEAFAALVRAELAKPRRSGTTPPKSKNPADGLFYHAGPTPPRLTVDDFFSYVDDEQPPSSPASPAAPPAPPPPPAPQAPDPDELVLAGAAAANPAAVPLEHDAEVDTAYAARENSGRVEASLNGGLADQPRRSRPPLALRPLTAKPPQTRYMNDPIPARIEAVRARVRAVSARILARLQHLRGPDAGELPALAPQSFFVPSPDVVLAVGRIRVDHEESQGVAAGRINPSSIKLESEDGNRVALSLKRMHEQKVPLFLHPGMIVVVEGVNTNGRTIEVHAIYDNAMPVPKEGRKKRKPSEQPTAAEDDDVEMEPNLAQPTDDQEPCATVIVAAGPYSTTANLNYEPLDDLLAAIARTRPDAVFLTGPFVDADHPQISSSTPVPFEKIFESRVLTRLRKAMADMTSAEEACPQFVLIPSLGDVHHDFVCPQPPFSLGGGHPLDARIMMLPNPGVVELSARKGTCVASIGVTSLPSLQDISGDCLCWNKGDRFSAIASHMLRQCTFYPTFPPTPSVPLDCSMLDDLSIPDMEQAPTLDVLVTPSKLKAFIKTVDGGAVAVNPGLLCRGSSGGSYAELRIPLHEAVSLRSLNANADKLQGSIVRL